MSTNLEVVTDALRELAVIAETETASSEQGSYGVRKLNDMMAVWYDDGFDIGFFPQDSTADDFPCSAQYLLPVKLGLAIQMAPNYGAAVSAELAANFHAAYESSMRAIINAKLKGANMDHLPIGEAWSGGVSYNIATDR